MYRITKGQIITENEILQGYDLFIEGDIIKSIVPAEEAQNMEGMEVVDANNAYIAPGFIDIHADYIEHMAAPRPTSLMDFEISIREAEKVLIGSGITTMYHSLSLFQSNEFGHNLIRSSENVKKLIDVIDSTHKSKHLIRHRFHARFEIDNFNEFENLKRYLQEDKVHLLSFMDHTPGQGQYRNLEIYKKTLKGYNSMTEEELDEVIEKRQRKEKITLDMLEELAGIASKKNIAIASHDDDSVEKLEIVKRFGTTISEFPITMEVAQKAKSLGLYTIAGAPNVLLGGSHSGNLSAAEAILQDTVDILCSDYYPPALLHAVFILHEKYGQDLCKMIGLVTINPAKAVYMDGLIGSIAENKKADLLIIEKLEKNFPVITSVFVDGKRMLKTSYRQ
ncbi:MAG: phosphonate metabolism protein PhnM [Thermotaleaceae bacterium]